MKKALKYLVLLLLCTINRNTQAQGYIPMLNSVSKWTVGRSVGTGANRFINYRVDSIGSSYTFPPPEVQHVYKSFKEPVGLVYLREDTSTRKVYIKHMSYLLPGESLLYDFSLNAGDSVILRGPTHPLGFSDYTYVDSVSYLTIQGVLRKVLYLRLHPNISYTYPNFINHHPINSFNNFGPLTWIEGIGTPYGVNYFRLAGNGMNSYEFLSCLTGAGNTIMFQNPFLQSCTQALGNTIDNIDDYITPYLYVTDQKDIAIAFNKENITNGKGSIQIYDSIGRLVFSDNSIDLVDEIKIRINDKREGTFLLVYLTVKNELYTFKLVL
jgi:hypothetical protein